MKTYKIGFARRRSGDVELYQLCDTVDGVKDVLLCTCTPEQAATKILLDVVRDVDCAFHLAARFAKHWVDLKQPFPLYFDERRVLKWVGEQTSASV